MAFDSADTAFMLLSAALVMLMTPGLAFFYGGLVGRKNVLTIMMQSFVSLAITDIIWFTVGYSLSFSGGAGGIYGDLNNAFLMNMDVSTPWSGNPQVPAYAFFVYQLMFAIITPALITGAFANRVSFKAYLIFLVAWLMLVYIPFVHMIWGGGALAAWGVLDFAGGIVVHAIAGMAALASVLFLGARKVKEKGPHSIPLVALGTGLLWFGWYGFNAGSAGNVSEVAVVAFVNTDLAASMAGVVWLVWAWVFEKKPKFLGLLTGMVAGLATITPAAGYVTPGASLVIGILAGSVCYLAIMFKNKRKWDDALDVWGVHGVGGILGIVSLGLFGTVSVNALGANGLLYGNATFFGKEVAAAAFAAGYAFAFTWAMLWIINKVTPVRVSEDEEKAGLDESLHGEEAYDDADPAPLATDDPKKPAQS